MLHGKTHKRIGSIESLETRRMMTIPNQMTMTPELLGPEPEAQIVRIDFDAGSEVELIPNLMTMTPELLGPEPEAQIVSIDFDAGSEVELIPNLMTMTPE